MQSFAEILHQLDYEDQILYKSITSSLPQQYKNRFCKTHIINNIQVLKIYKNNEITYEII